LTLFTNVPDLGKFRTFEPVGPITACCRAALIYLTLLVIILDGSGAWGEERVPTDPQIARLNHAGFKSRGHCTGFATREGPLVTAAHCLPKIRTDTVHILLGYESGELGQHIKNPGTSYRIMPGRDIAALCDIHGSPDGFRLTDISPKAGTRVVVQGYGAPRVHALQKTACSVLSLPQDDLMRLDCPLPPGTSGAPVTLTGTRDIVGVISASSATGSLASRLSAGMMTRLCD
jgi:hypothetical protein